MNPFRSQINKSTNQIHHEVGQISNEAQSRDSHHRAQERNSGERHHRGRRRGDEHPPQERQDDSQEQGPRQPGESLNQRKQHPILHSARVAAPGELAD